MLLHGASNEGGIAGSLDDIVAIDIVDSVRDLQNVHDYIARLSGIIRMGVNFHN